MLCAAMLYGVICAVPTSQLGAPIRSEIRKRIVVKQLHVLLLGVRMPGVRRPLRGVRSDGEELSGGRGLDRRPWPTHCRRPPRPPAPRDCIAERGEGLSVALAGAASSLSAPLMRSGVVVPLA